MRTFLILALAGLGCATAQPPQQAGKVDLNRCTFVGAADSIYYRPQNPSYRVINDKLYSCPAS